MEPRRFQKSSQKIRIIPLGGLGEVTKNMFLYEYLPDGRGISDILVVDCGVGFPDEVMFGVDLVIPDSSYLLDKREKVRGIILTHGHEDHIAALPYILPKVKAPVFGTRLTAALAEVKLREFAINTKINIITENQTLHFGPFEVSPVHVTHSIPDAVNFIIKTPVGTFYHGSDFKFDPTPIDRKQTEVGKIARAGANGVLCLLSDCVRSEKPGYTLSEEVIEDTLEKEIRECPGKLIFTTQSSNISRIEQAIKVAVRHNRKIAFFGRSMEQNSEVSHRLGYLHWPQNMLLREREIKKFPAKELFLIVAGSQGQASSALSRTANQDHKFLTIKEGDTVVFSADPIPGNENAVHSLIDQLTILGARVFYSDVLDELHVSGHAAQNELMLMLSLVRPKYVLPIGGTFRQMKQYAILAEKMGYQKQQIILPQDGQTLEFDSLGKVNFGPKLELKNIMVDGLGVGDVGNVVLRDRQTMATDGIVVIVVPIEGATGRVSSPDIISRGFVYMKESGELIDKAKLIVLNSLRLQKGRIVDWQFVKKQIGGNLEEFLYKETGRRPMILPVVVEV